MIGNDGWESVATDIIGIHDYDANPERIARALRHAEDRCRALFDRERPGGRLLTLDGYAHRGQPIMLTEFGGIALRAERTDAHLGLHRAPSDAEELARALRARCCDVVRSLRCSPASATRSSPTPTRRRTAC